MSKLGLKIFKILISTTFIFSIILVGAYYFVYTMELKELGNEALKSIKVDQKLVDADKLQAVLDANSDGVSEYKELQKDLLLAKADQNVRYLYTMAKKNSKKAYIVVDGSKDPEQLGYTYTMDKEMKEALQVKFLLKRCL